MSATVFLVLPNDFSKLETQLDLVLGTYISATQITEGRPYSAGLFILPNLIVRSGTPTI